MALAALYACVTPSAAQAQAPQGPATLAAGMHFTCAVHEGHAVCWGSNEEGQLGDGGTTSRAAPTPVPGVADVVEVAAGASHACARTSGGDVFCWGDNSHGQVAGPTAARSVRSATRVQGVSGATRLSVGGYHSCALVARGVARCWGSNGSGQSGGREDTAPTDIAGVRGATGLWSGLYHSCVIAPSGVACWGDGSSGQLGTGNHNNAARARAVRGLPRGVTGLALGRQHTCALTASGAYCWGYEPFAVAGERDPARARPQHVTTLDGSVSLFAGGNTTCALDATGVARCRGDNLSGEAGNASRDPVDRPARIEGSSPSVELAVGAMHVCARGRDGGVACWGDDSAHQCGRRTPTFAATPVEVVLPPGAAPVRSLSVEGGQSCISTSAGAIYCWGIDRAGVQVGAHRDVFGVREHPTPVDGVAGAMRVVTGGIDTCALGGHGLVACWGANLGRSANGDPGVRNPRALALPTTRQLAVAGGTACGVDDEGQVRCVGINVDGVRGDGTESFSARPSAVSLGFPAVSVSGGGYTMCAMGAEGQLGCWGRGAGGQRGDGQSASGPTPSRVVGPPAWTSVAVGREHGCAALPNGQVYCWGRGNEGQLGNGARASYAAPVAVQTLGSATQVSVGGQHSCARTREGGVMCWGLGSLGQLGDGTTESRQAPVVVTGLTDVTEVHCGDTHSCALTATGRVLCWGDARDGQLGNGVSHYARSPSPVTF